jgi:hypothetical protein
MMATLSRLFPRRGALVKMKPDTLVRWHRKGSRLFWRWKSKPTGRPRLRKRLRQLIREMATTQNPSWGQERVANQWKLKLGIRVSPRTVENYLRDGPLPTRSKPALATFVHNHAKVIVACDFFLVVTATFRTLYVFVILELATRRMLHQNVAAHPAAGWTSQQLQEARRPSISIRDPRPGQHLLEAVGPGGDGPWSESAANAGAGTHAKPSSSLGRQWWIAKPVQSASGNC